MAGSVVPYGTVASEEANAKVMVYQGAWFIGSKWAC